jgi:hypothetical protein
MSNELNFSADVTEYAQTKNNLRLPMATIPRWKLE